MQQIEYVQVQTKAIELFVSVALLQVIFERLQLAIERWLV